MGGGDKGEDGSDDAFELDDNVAVFVDALDDAFDASEFTFCDDDSTTHLVGYGGEVEEGYTVVGEGGYTHEVVHLVVGHVDDLRTYGGVEWPRHHIPERTEVFIGHLEGGELMAGGVDEEEVVDGGNKLEMSMSGTFDEFVGDGEERLDALLVKARFHLQLTVVGDTHGIPEGLGAEVVHR